MLTAIPSQYHLLISIGGLVILLLLITGAAQRYQAYQLEKEAALRRILRGISQIESILSMIQDSAAAKKLKVLLRKEVLARYLAVRQIHKRLDNLDNLIATAQRNLQVAESRGEVQLIKPSERSVFNNYIKGIGELIKFLSMEGHIAGMNTSERLKYQHDLSALRADYVSLYHSTEARELAKQQMWTAATNHLKEALGVLSALGPNNEHVNNTYKQLTREYKQVINGQVPGVENTSNTQEELLAENPAEAANTEIS